MLPAKIHLFPSSLGWMALVTAGTTVKRLTFGHPSAAAAHAALGPDAANAVSTNTNANPLVARLQAYANGAPDDLHDVAVDSDYAGTFQATVLKQCRRVKYGATITYAELAAKSGSARAARAVGNCMAANRVPLIVPCHRVVCSSGRLGSYSAEGGAEMKRRLLALEASK